MATRPSIDTAPIPARRPLWRRVLRIVARVLAVILVLIVLGVTFLHTPWGKSFVRGRIEHVLAKKVNGTVKLGSLDYGFLFSHVTLGDLEIRTLDGKPAIAIAQIDVALDRGALLDKAIVIDDLAIRGLAVAVEKHADGTTNLTGLAKPSGPRKPLAHVQIKKLAVAGSATITKPDGTVIAIRDLAIAGTVDAHPIAQQVDLALDSIATTVEVSAPSKPARTIAVSIKGIGVKRAGDAIDATIASIAAGAVGIEAIGAHVVLKNGKPTGDQKITLGKARIDSKQLATLVGREVLVDDVALDLSIAGPANALVLHGNVETRDTTLALDGTIDAAAVTPSYTLAIAGKGKSIDVVVPKPGKKMPAVETDVRIDVKGSGVTPLDLDAEVNVAVGATTIDLLKGGDPIAIEGLTAKAFAKRGAYKLESFAAHGIGFDITASGDMAVDRSVTARLDVAGSPAHAIEVLGAAGIAVPRKAPSIGHIVLGVTAAGRLDGEMVVTLEPTKIPLAGGSIALSGDATLDHKKLKIANTTVTLARLDLGGLARLAGKPAKARGRLSGTLTLTKTPTERHATYAFTVALADKPLVVGVSGTAGLTSATAKVDVRRTSDRAVIAAIGATLPLDAKGLNLAGPWKVSVDVAHRSLAEFAELLPEKSRAKIPPGEVAIHAELAGSPTHPTGTIEVTASAAALKTIPNRQDITLRAVIGPSPRGLAVTTDGTIAIADLGTLATLRGTITMPFRFHGKRLDVPALRAGLQVDTTIDIPERPLASLAVLRAKLAELGGTIGGKITVRGAAKTPAIAANLAWRGYHTAAGADGATTIAASGTPTALVLAIDHDGLKITADVDRKPDRIAVRAKTRADKLPLLAILPDFAAAKLSAVTPGVLDWNMDADLVLVKTATGMALDQVAVTGSLDVSGAALALPNTKRRYHDIALSVVGEPNAIRIKSLTAHESDVDVKDRRIDISGVLALDKAHPTHLDLTLAARDWLVFGGEKFGKPDAPRGTATFDIGVAVDLTKPVLGVDATVNNLALLAPDRQDRGHFAEEASVSGDIIYVDHSAAGKLPVPPVVVAAPKAARRAIDVRIHIPKPIHVQSTPMDVTAHGELTVTVRDEVATRGTLTLDGGTLNLFGYDHKLVDGTLAFTDEHPHGWLALSFERKLPDYALRELADPKVGSGISLSGPPGKPKTSLGGNANAAMMEVMAMYNAGRPVNVSRPGLPASATVQAPRGDQLFMLTFMASNLPHLLFLDRITAWADPYQGANTYGQISNMEAEKYTSAKTRVRGVVRPPTPGRSEGELQVDRMLINNDRTAVGVGVRAGDRLGGGVGLFFEWSR